MAGSEWCGVVPNGRLRIKLPRRRRAANPLDLSPGSTSSNPIVSLRAIRANPSLHWMMTSKIVPATGSGDAAIGVPPAERLLLDIIDTVREPLLVLDSEFRVTQANRAFFQTFHVVPEDTIGELLFALGDGQWDIEPLRELLRDRLAAESELYDVEVDHVFPGIGRKIMLLNARLVAHGPSASRVILLAIEDVTERRLTERRLAAQRRELQRSNAALN